MFSQTDRMIEFDTLLKCVDPCWRLSDVNDCFEDKTCIIIILLLHYVCCT